jgi:hypothetical protein
VTGQAEFDAWFYKRLASLLALGNLLWFLAWALK